MIRQIKWPRPQLATRVKNVATPTLSAADGVATPVSSVEAGQRGQQSATIRYLNRADLQETFADSVTGFMFDWQMLRIEFGVMRLDEVKANAPLSGRRYPTCRLVIPPAAAVDLINRMQRIAEALTQAGVVKDYATGEQRGTDRGLVSGLSGDCGLANSRPTTKF